VSTRVDSFAEWSKRFAVLQADDWFIWVEHRPSGLVYAYNTELWEEWLDMPEGDFMGESNPPDGPAVARMIPFAWRYSPRPWRVWSDELGCELDRQETRAEWDAREAEEAERMLEWALARAYAAD
jgi:hypothetical protein